MDATITAPEDPGHLLPDEDWAAVVAAAELEAQRIAAGHRAAEAPDLLVTATRYSTGALPVAGQVVAPRNGGRRKRGAPTFGVIHSAETPLRAGYAASIARYFRDKAPTSCHYMTDPAETWGVLPDELVAWHCGNGNPNSLALEQAGYARMSRAEWTTPEGLAQLHRNAAVMRAARDRYGIGLYWMNDQQLRDAHAGRSVGGWATHDQCRRVLGGTSHTDPGGGFPYDLQMQLALDPQQAGDDDVTYSQWPAADRVALINDVAWAVLHHRVPAAQRTRPDGTPIPDATTTLAAMVGWNDAHLDVTRALIADVSKVDVLELAGHLAGPLTAAVSAELADVDGITEAEAEAATERALRRVLGGLRGPGA